MSTITRIPLNIRGLAFASATAATYALTQNPTLTAGLVGTYVLSRVFFGRGGKSLETDLDSIGIQIVCKKDWDGNGDLTHAIAVRSFLQRRYPSVTISLLAQTQDEQHGLEKMGLKVPLSVDFTSQKVRNLVIQLPVLKTPLQHIGEKADLLHVGEYSYETILSNQAKEGWFRSSGAGPEELGVFVVEDEDFNRGQERKASQDIKKLTETVADNTKGIDLSSDKVYFGYTGCWFGVRRWLATLSAINSLEKNGVTTFIAGSRLLDFDQGGSFNILQGHLSNPDFLAYVASKGVSSIETWVKDGSKELKCVNKISTSRLDGKSIRLVLPGFISSQDMVNFLLYSTPLTIATGDGSYTKALSLGIPSINECPMHKRKSARNIQSIAPEKVQRMLDLTTFLKGDNDFKEYAEKVAEHMRLEDSASIDDFKEMARELKLNHNYEKGLAGLVGEWIEKGPPSKKSSYQRY